MASLKDLFKKLLDKEKEAKEAQKDLDLPNTQETWERIGNKDSFEELGLNSGELATFLKEWCENNEGHSK